MITGKIIPPIAAKTGKLALRILDNSPIITSLFISRPITKKKIAISPSLIQRISDLDRTKLPMPNVSF